MDPQAAWNALLDAYEDHQWEDLEEHALALFEWLAKGGFPPQTVPGRQLDTLWDGSVARAACVAAFMRSRSLSAGSDGA